MLVMTSIHTVVAKSAPLDTGLYNRSISLPVGVPSERWDLKTLVNVAAALA